MSAPTLDPQHTGPSPVTRALEALTGLLIAILVMEAGVRWTAVEPTLIRGVPVNPFEFGPYPGDHGSTPVIRDGLQLKVPFTSNSLGFRDIEHSPTKPPGTTRIGVFGDSYLPGLAVDQEKILHFRTEEALEASGARAEVLNFGAVAYSTSLNYLTFLEKARDYDLDVVVLFFTQNDPWDVSLELGSSDVPYLVLQDDGSLKKVKREAARKQKKRTGLGGWIKENLRLYEWQKDQVERLELWWKRHFRKGKSSLPKVYHPLVQPMDPRIEEAWTLTYAVLDAFHAECASRGIRFVVVDIPLQEGVFPARFEFSARRFPALRDLEVDWDLSVERLGGWCRTNQVPYLDLRGPLKSHPAGPALFIDHDGHFTTLGHEVVGETLARFLLESGAVPRSPESETAGSP